MNCSLYKQVFRESSGPFGGSSGGRIQERTLEAEIFRRQSVGASLEDTDLVV